MLNTNSSYDNLAGRLIANMVSLALSYIAEAERMPIRQREGIEVVKRKGVKFDAIKHTCL